MFPIPFVELKNPKKRKYNNSVFKGEVYDDFFVKVRDFFIPISHLPLIYQKQFSSFDSSSAHKWIDFVDRRYDKYLENKVYNNIININFSQTSEKVKSINSISKYLLKFYNDEDIRVIKALGTDKILFSRDQTIRSRTMASYYYYLIKDGYIMMPLPMKSVYNLNNIELPKIKYLTLLTPLRGFRSYIPPDFGGSNYFFKSNKNAGSLFTPYEIVFFPNYYTITTYGGLHWRFKKTPNIKNYEIINCKKLDKKTMDELFEKPGINIIHVGKILYDRLKKEYMIPIAYTENSFEIVDGIKYSINAQFSENPEDVKFTFIKIPADKGIKLSEENNIMVLKIKGVNYRLKIPQEL